MSAESRRRSLVDAARQQWIRKLVDLSRRNNLLYFRDLKAGTLDLSAAPDAVMAQLLQSHRVDAPPVKLAALVPTEKLAAASGQLREVSRRAQANFEERGLETMFLALGMASWNASDGGRPTEAPVLLIPVTARPTGRAFTNWVIQRTGDVRVNDVLTHALAEEHGAKVDLDKALEEFQGDDEGEPYEPELFFKALIKQAKQVPGFEVRRRCVVGNFAFQKMAIVNDLKRLADALTAHDLIGAIAGDKDAAGAVAARRTSVDPKEFDARPPDNEFLILDADSSQHRAIESVLRGDNGVVSGPPGTGKSQTIANLIAELVAQGKSVLFVAEKRAALDVVLRRLSNAGLGHLCLDCHGAELTRKQVAEQLQVSLDRHREAPVPETADVHKRLVQRRTALTTHSALMNTKVQPWGLTPVEVYGKLMKLPAASRSGARVTPEALRSLTPQAIESVRDAVEALQSLDDLVTEQSSAAWADAALADSEAARQGVEAARSLAGGRWAAALQAVDAVCSEAGVPVPVSLSGIPKTLALLRQVQVYLSECTPEMFELPLPEAVATLAPARSWWAHVWALVSNGNYRRTLSAVRGCNKAGQLRSIDALKKAEEALALRTEWRALCGSAQGNPKALTLLDAAEAAYLGVRGALDSVVSVFPRRSLDSQAPGDVAGWLSALAADGVTPARVVKLHELRQLLTNEGFAALWPVLKAGDRPAAEWPDVFEACWLQSCLEELQLRHPELSTFSGRGHDRVAREFRELDAKRLGLAVQRVQRAHAVKALGARNANSTQDQLVLKEAKKKSKHLPLRRLFAEAPDVLLALRPCWMASPLSVSQLIPGDRQVFDVIIFDEASQVLPEDAITSLLRGRQAVIAGDRHQLPPTTFFAAGDPDSAEEDDATGGFQSILDVLSAFLDPPWDLNWHYRSRDEALIAFSNIEIYGEKLVTFPGAGSAPAVRHELVQPEPGQALQQASVSAEVRRVVDLVKEHAREYADESLGVITMGIEHARRIEAALDEARFMDADLEAFLSDTGSEKFFVKNLERVQGDERDAIILSIGYGKNDAGQMVYRFGPLLHEGGERRLNVAVTRARQRMTVVSSFTHNDLDPEYHKLGVRLLRGYLEFAASGGTRLARGKATDLPLNAFEESVRDELVRQGLKVIGQVGSSKYRIDLVVMHPEQDGRFVLAVECDGASYHSSPTARDRDRLRQQQLEALGWRFHRIWSTDWFLRRDDEVKRLMTAYEAALKAADAPAPPAAPRRVVVEAEPEAAAPRAATRQSRKPRFVPGTPITEYAEHELEAIVRWIQSDDVLRTDQELVDATAAELGFARRGSRIVERIKDAIRATRL